MLSLLFLAAIAIASPVPQDPSNTQPRVSYESLQVSAPSHLPKGQDSLVSSEPSTIDPMEFFDSVSDEPWFDSSAIKERFWDWFLGTDDFGMPGSGYPIGYRGLSMTLEEMKTHDIDIPTGPMLQKQQRYMLGPGLYLTDEVSVARNYAVLSSETNDRYKSVCKIYTTSKKAFLNMRKVWIPKNEEYYYAQGQQNRTKISQDSSLMLSTFDVVPRYANGHPYQMVIPWHLFDSGLFKKACVEVEETKGMDDSLDYQQRSSKWKIEGEVPYYRRPISFSLFGW